ncbi:MAG TPA: cytidine deaminase [Actinomycetaceae bacterium]|nr:cytidine deaminase [Actinomycetaceae bacterium]
MTDWEILRREAIEAARHAYVPYSGYQVGAAALTDDGRVISGCNVENASLGATLCAECGLVSDLHRGGGGRLVAFLCVNRDGHVIAPCGRCRQLLWEHGGAALRVLMPEGETTMDKVLPQAFDAADMAAVADPRPAGPEEE